MADASTELLLGSLFDATLLTDAGGRIQVWNRAAVDLAGHAGDEVIGQRCGRDLLSCVDDHGRRLCERACPLRACLDDGEPREQRTYLLHRGGHRVGVRQRVVPIRAGAGVFGAMQVFRSLVPTVSDGRLPRPAGAIADPIPGVIDRRSALRSLSVALAAAEDGGEAPGVLLVAIDGHDVLEAFGAAVAGRAMDVVGRTLTWCRGPGDRVGRWGDGRLLVVVDGVGGVSLIGLAERLRRLIKVSRPYPVGVGHDVTVSIAAAQGWADDDARSLVERAELRLGIARRRGPDRVIGDEPAGHEAALVGAPPAHWDRSQQPA